MNGLSRILRASFVITALLAAQSVISAPKVGKGSVQAAVDSLRFSGVFPVGSASLEEFYRKADMDVQWSVDLAAQLAEISGQEVEGRWRKSPFQIAQLDVQASMLAIELINRAKAGSYPQQVATTEDLSGLKLALQAGTEQQYLQALGQGNSLLRQLRLAESSYSEIVSSGGWRVLDQDEVELTDRSAAVAGLKLRLRLEGYKAGEGKYFNTQLERALRQYQGVQNLAINGALDERTRRALNVPAWKRLRALRANLARFETRGRLGTENAIIVNIPAFKGEYFNAGKRVWVDRVIVGKADRRTPQISSELQKVVFNPSWYVPSKLVWRDILPRASKEPAYWQRMGYQAFDRDGQVREVAMGTGLSEQFAAERLRIKQPPGPRNALGQVKFMFPNKYAVFLHDTPSKHLFGREVRAFSSGCVRVQEPLKLAEILFKHQSESMLASRKIDSIEQMIASKKTQSVRLVAPVSVSTIYLTTEPLASGRVRFYPDIYSYDTADMASAMKTSLAQS